MAKCLTTKATTTRRTSATSTTTTNYKRTLSTLHFRRHKFHVTLPQVATEKKKELRSAAAMRCQCTIAATTTRTATKTTRTETTRGRGAEGEGGAEGAGGAVAALNKDAIVALVAVVALRMPNVDTTPTCRLARPSCCLLSLPPLVTMLPAPFAALHASSPASRFS